MLIRTCDKCDTELNNPNDFHEIVGNSVIVTGGYEDNTQLFKLELCQSCYEDIYGDLFPSNEE